VQIIREKGGEKTDYVAGMGSCSARNLRPNHKKGGDRMKQRGLQEHSIGRGARRGGKGNHRTNYISQP